MRRLDDRLDAAIARASRHFFNQLLFKASNGAVIKICAVKKRADTAPDVVGGATAISRRDELIVSEKTFAEMKRASGGKLDAKSIKGALILERTNSEEIEYRFDQAKPFDENTANGSAIRLYVYRK